MRRSTKPRLAGQRLILPSNLARELLDSFRKYLRATFPMTTPLFRRSYSRTMLEDFLAEPGALFKGPYLQFGLPFRKASVEEQPPFKSVKVSFTPYLQQMRAFRLFRRSQV